MAVVGRRPGGHGARRLEPVRGPDREPGQRRRSDRCRDRPRAACPCARGHAVTPAPMPAERLAETKAKADQYNYPHLSIEKRLYLAANPDLGEEAVQGWRHGDGDGCREEILGLLAHHDWLRDVAAARALGLVGDWGMDDVYEAVTEALHDYPVQRAEVDRLTTVVQRHDAHHERQMALISELSAE